MRGRGLIGASVAIAWFAMAAETAAPGGSPVLTVGVTGDGRVTSAPPGIDCPRDCDETYPRDPAGSPQTVELTATPGSGQELKGWGGACSGTESCSVVMTVDRSVTAEFGPAPETPPPPPGSANLSVEVSAGGSVAGPGVACPSDCAETVPEGTAVPLTPTPHPDFTFT